MKRLMTFENYAMENFDDPDAKFSNDGCTYFLYMFDQTPGAFSGEVRDANGKCVYEITPKTMEDSVMQTPNDVTGLRKHLIEKKKLKELDTIEVAESAPQTNSQTNTTSY